MAWFIWEASRRIDYFCRAGAVGFFSLMVLATIFQVLARYIFQSAPVWTEEAARYCMIWGGLLGATTAFRLNLEPRLMPAPGKNARLTGMEALLVRSAAVVLFLGPILFHADQFLSRAWLRSSEALGISAFWIGLSLPVWAVVIFVHLLARLLNGGRLPDRSKEALIVDNF